MTTATGASLALPLRDVIDIPQRISADDFVLQLHAGVTTGAEQTLRDYVVTGGIAGAFDEALGLVRSALRQGKSKGAFVHGSFGAGKSHFMAVTQLLLSGSATARQLPGLQDVVSRYQDVLDKRYLSVDYHLLGKSSLEQALFSGYLSTVARLHPEAPPPVLHRSDTLLQDADRLREQVGDDSFFARLATPTDDDGWGDQAGTWTAARYDAARRLAADASERQDLVRALVDAYYQSQTTTGEYLEITAGLKAMTEHARGLGYDGVLLFLDELVLWLGQHLGDTSFIQRETSKVAKLVETESGSLPVPIVSFVARQRDLKDFLGGGTVGAQQVALGQSFQWWEDRFDKITLAAADLPEIVNKRLLTPVDQAGADALAGAVARIRANPTAWRHLLEDEAGSSGGDFAKVYPFSPALVDAMIALSSLMQRERTALKLMSELLSQGRGELTVGDLVPVGDLFDVVVLGDAQPLTEDMKRLFQVAGAFYRTRMRPGLLGKHDLTEAATAGLGRRHSFRNDDRLAKTLLVAEIAAGAASLKNLTASKLAALNYGTVVSFVPGQEAQQVVTLARSWAAAFGEVSVGPGNDPVISIALSGVDHDAVLDRVQSEDTVAARRRLVREAVLAELGATSGGLMDPEHRHVWRGQARTVDVVFGNVRDVSSLGDEAFVAAPGRWKVVVDFPFDDEGQHPSDDVARVERLQDQRVTSSTVVWLPHFLTAARMDDIGTLVQLDHLLTGQHFDENAVNLPVNDREPARRQLANRRDSLREQLATALRQAYAVQAPTPEYVGEHAPVGATFLTLTQGLQVAVPHAVTLRGFLDDVLGQALAYQHPEHPEIASGDVEVRPNDLAGVLDLARRAVEQDGRVAGVERARAGQLRRVVEGYRIGTLRENVYALDAASFGWWDAFTRWSALGEREVSVAALRRELEPYGMTTAAEDLLILTWAALADRVAVQHGTVRTQPLAIGQLQSALVLREPVLPDEDVWAGALARAGALFGLGAGELNRSTAAVRRISQGVRERLVRSHQDTRALVDALTEHARTLGLDQETQLGRLATARRADDLVQQLASTTDDLALLRQLAGFDLPEEAQALARSIASAPEVVAALRGASWHLLDQVGSLADGADAPVAAALGRAAASEELHEALAPALAEGSRAMTALLVDRRSAPDEGAERRAAAERERRAEEEARRREADRRLAAQQAALAVEQAAAEQERARLDAQRRDDERQRSDRDEAARRAPSHLIEPGGGVDDVTRALRAALDSPKPGKRLRVTWTWE